MQKNKIYILSTRPVGEELIAKAAKTNIIIDEISFIKTNEITGESIEKKIKEHSKKNITAVFTSRNAVEAVGKYVSPDTDWKIFCTGSTTKSTIKKYFKEKNIAGTADSASHLAETIIQARSVKNIVFFCGNQRRDELPLLLNKNSIGVEEIVVYNTISTPQILTKQYDGILFFSPSAVQSFFAKNSITKKTKLFAIGSTTAKSLTSFTQQSIIIAKNPAKANLVSQVINHFSKSKSF